MNTVLNISSSPHVRDKRTTNSVMYCVALALLPAAVTGVWNHGIHALLVILASVITAVCSEFVFDYIVKKPNTVMDGSAFVTGLLLALCLPGSVPLYVPVIGALVAIIIVKCFFGGLGKNFINPAL
ncbi:MAG: Na+-transporting NADH:ubiquinone oxidoreductase subunit D, partial [Lachnospiraceae bacterium]|nr:Na+-transporting NADH:ubiquinone oxidoreductase subunit D [Lachnospiraceae bacterium]